LICRYSDYELQNVCLRSQDDFRLQLVEALISMGQNAPGSRKRQRLGLSGASSSIPTHRHELVRMTTRANCKACQGRRYQDLPRPKKRVALGEVTPNSQSGKRVASHYGCKQCAVHLCKKNNCFALYHSN
jgi:hypothetical protein